MLRLHTRPRGPSPLTTTTRPPPSPPPPPPRALGAAVLGPDLDGDVPLCSSHPHFKTITWTVPESWPRFRLPSNFFPVHSSTF